MKELLKKHGKTMLLYLKTQVWTCLVVWLISDCISAALNGDEIFYPFIYALSKISSTTYAFSLLTTLFIRLSGMVDEGEQGGKEK